MSWKLFFVQRRIEPPAFWTVHVLWPRPLFLLTSHGISSLQAELCVFIKTSVYCVPQLATYFSELCVHFAYFQFLSSLLLLFNRHYDWKVIQLTNEYFYLENFFLISLHFLTARLCPFIFFDDIASFVFLPTFTSNCIKLNQITPVSISYHCTRELRNCFLLRFCP